MSTLLNASPAKAGVQLRAAERRATPLHNYAHCLWTPAFAGVGQLANGLPDPTCLPPNQISPVLSLSFGAVMS